MRGIVQFLAFITLFLFFSVGKLTAQTVLNVDVSPSVITLGESATVTVTTQLPNLGYILSTGQIVVNPVAFEIDVFEIWTSTCPFCPAAIEVVTNTYTVTPTFSGVYVVQMNNAATTETLTVNPIQNTCATTDSLALVAFYNSTNGPNWTNTWDLAQPMSTWYGVTVNGDGCVVCLDLDGDAGCNEIAANGNNLIGNLPTEIGNFMELEYLYLSENTLTGNIPSTIGNLTALQDLDMSNNQLSGSIPSELGNLTYLFGLGLNSNQLSGTIPSTFGNLTNLEILDLNENQLSGNIPSGLGNLNNLQVLFLAENNLIGNIPNQLGTLTNLRDLWLHYNNLTGPIPPVFGNLSNLESLSLGGNPISGTIPPALGNLQNLWLLSVENCSLTGSIPTTLGNLSGLEYLAISDNSLTGTIPDELGSLSNLGGLYLQNNNLEGCIPPPVMAHCGLGFSTNISANGYNFSNNPFLPWQGAGTTFCASGGSQSAQVGAPCDDGNPNTSSDQIQANCSCAGMVVNPCRQTDSLALVALYNATNGPNWTNTWNLSQPMNTWYGVTVNVDGCVRRLILGNYQLLGILPSEIGDLANLEYLFLDNNQISGSIPSEIGNLSNLLQLSISNNFLSGSIPSEIGQLTELNRLNLANNLLSTSIPFEIGNLTNLTKLYLENNSLTGAIPWELGNLIEMEFLLLNDNQLTASIPAELSQLQNIQKIWLSNNDLDGCIPVDLLNLCSIGYASHVSYSGYNLTGNPLLPWQGDFTQFCATNGSLSVQIGAPCDDGDQATTNDQIQANCLCAGTAVNNSCLVTNTNDAGAGSLRAAIDCANSNPGRDTIRFAISGVGPHEIQINTSGLVLTDEGTVLDGTTQPGFSLGDIVINKGITTDTVGVFIRNDSIEVYGLDIQGFEYGIYSIGSDGVQIGGLDKGNICHGVGMSHGIFIQNINSIDVVGNIVGLNRLAVISDSPQMCCAITANGSGARIRYNHVVGYNGGITLIGDNGLIQRNIVGVDSSGLVFFSVELPLGVNNGSNHLIEENIVANAGQSGIYVGQSDLVKISRNQVFCNRFGGIVLDNGNNNLLSPIINSIDAVNGLVGTAPPNSIVELFISNNTGCSNAPCQGKTYLGAVIAQANGNWQRMPPFSTNLLQGDFVTATATVGNRTSEFSNCFEVLGVIPTNCDRIRDSLALVDIYNAAGGSGWINNTNWLSVAPLETWYGVDIHTGGDCVRALDLVENNLIGTLSPSIGNLTSANTIRINGNSNLVGPLPTNWSNMQNLTWLSLYNNGFTDTIPKEMGFMSNLSSLALFGNQLSGGFPEELGNLSNLLFFFMDDNNFDTPLPLAFLQLDSFNLTLQGNQFTFEDLVDILPNLKIYPSSTYHPQASFFSDTLITRTIGDALTIDLGIDAAVSDNNYQWYKDGVSWFPPTPNVSTSNQLIFTSLQATDAGVYRVEVTNAGAPDLTLYSRDITLEVLPISACDPVSDSLALVDLYNSTNGVGWINQWDFMAPLNSWYRVTLNSEGCVDSLLLQGNNLSGILPDLNLPELVYFRCDGNRIGGAIPDFSFLKNLDYFDCGVNDLMGAIPDFTDMPKLRLFDCDFNDLSGSIPDFTGTPLLATLDCDSNQLSGIIPNFQQVPNLLYISFGKNDLNGLIPDLNACPNLRIALFIDNGFTFEDILPNFSRFNALSQHDYAPQDSIFTDTLITRNIGDALTIDLGLDAAVSDNNYQWYKDGVSWFPPAPNVSTSNQLIFTSLQATDAGVYRVEVTNAGAPDLTLYSRDITLEVLPNSSCNPVSDSLALVDLYNSTNGNTWSNNMNWLVSGQAISTWHGITVTTDGCVQKISLGNNNLSGIIPDLNLPELDALYLFTTNGVSTPNQLIGPLPNFSNIPKLETLALYNNEIDGQIPNFQNFPVLKTMDVGGNRLSGSIPDFVGMPDIRWLYLYYNEFTGSIPDFSNMPELQFLTVSGNNLTGSIPNFTNAPKLYSIGFHSNNLKGVIPDFSLMDSLDMVNSFGNQLTFEHVLPNIVANEIKMPNPLNYIYAPQDSIFTDTLITRNIGDALTIDLGMDASVPDNNYQWYKDGLSWFPPAPNVSTSNQLIFTNLQAIDAGVYRVEVTNAGAPDLTLYSRDITLEVLPNCAVNDSLALVALYNATNGLNWTNAWDLAQPISTWYGVTVNGDGCVTCLDLDGDANCSNTTNELGNGLSGILPNELSTLGNLRYLYLHYNNLTGSIPASFGNLTLLEQLSLHENQLTGEIPSSLGALSNLKYLNIRSNQLTGLLPSALGDLSNLEVLSLSFNQFTGTIPTSFGSLGNLTIFSLFSNGITGTIPTSLGNLTNLRYLSFSGNNLSGIIPSSFGSLSSLEILDMFGNNLSGAIPSELGNLTNLTHLYLQNNNLDGCYPQSLLIFCPLGFSVSSAQSGYNLLGNPLLPWEGDLTQFCTTNGTQTAQAGAPCDDGNPSTSNDQIQADCSCAGTLVSNCDIIINLSATPDSSCFHGAYSINASSNAIQGRYEWYNGTNLEGTGTDFYDWFPNGILLSVYDSTQFCQVDTLIDYLPAPFTPEVSILAFGNLFSSNNYIDIPFLCNDGDVELTAVVDFPSTYTYFWGNGDNQAFTILDDIGSYGLTVTNAQGCSYTNGVNLIATPFDLPNTPTTDIPGVICNSSNQTVLRANSSGMNGGYYSWSLHELGFSNTFDVKDDMLIQSDSDSANIVISNYSFATDIRLEACVKAINVCGLESPVICDTIFVTGFIEFDVFAPDTTACVGDTVQLEVSFDTGVSTTPYTMFFLENGILDSIQGNGDFIQEYTEATTFQVWSVRDGFGCEQDYSTFSLVDTIRFNQGPPLTIVASNPDITCMSPDFTIQAQSSDPNASYAWLWPDGSNSVGAEVNHDGAGIYTVVATSLNAGTCESMATFEVVDLIEYPEIDATSETLDCNSGEATLFATATISTQDPLTFAWQNSQGQMVSNSATATVQSADNYTVFVTGVNGCTALLAVEVLPATQVEAIENVEPPLCFGGLGEVSIQVNQGIAPYQYALEGGIFQNTNSFIGLPAAQYRFVVLDAENCADTILVLIDTPEMLQLSANQTNPVSVVGASDASASIEIGNGVAPYSINWSGPKQGGFTQLPSGMYSITDLSEGTYTLLLTDALGCTTQSIFEISACAFSVQANIVDVLCNGENTGQIELSVSGNAYLYDWENNNFDGNNEALNLIAGIYSLTVTEVASDCSIPLQIEIVEPPLLRVSNIETNCQNGNTEYLVSFTIEGGTPPYKINGESIVGNTFISEAIQDSIAFSFIVIDANNCSIANIEGLKDCACLPTTANISIEMPCDSSLIFGNILISEAGSYQQTFQNNLGCDSLVTLQVDLLPIPPYWVETTICAGETYLFDGVELNQAGEYEALFTSANGCDSLVILSLLIQEAVFVQAEKDKVALTSDVILADITTNDKIEGATDIFLTIIQAPIHGMVQVQIDNSIEYRLVNTDFIGIDSFQYLICIEGCTEMCDTAWVLVYVDRDCFTIGTSKIQKHFAPDSDISTQPIFDPVKPFIDLGCPVDIEKTELIVYNRWGEIVYTQMPYEPWIGKNSIRSTQSLPKATYYYILNLSMGEKYQIKGAVNLLK